VQNDNENEDLIFLEIAFGPYGRRTRFMGYSWAFMFKKSRDDGFYLTQIAVNARKLSEIIKG
jgi:hypothetical protein